MEANAHQMFYTILDDESELFRLQFDLTLTKVIYKFRKT